MAPSINSSNILFVMLAIIIISIFSSSTTTCAQLTPDFYGTSCPNLEGTVRNAMAQAVKKEARMGASMLRLFFHDCFVNGCDASILLDDTATFTGEKNAGPNLSVRGYEVVDTIKSLVESSCNNTVSCADILALATRDGVALLGGPSWKVPLGRRDAKTASKDLANRDIPSPFENLPELISLFKSKGLTASEMTILSGGHSIGQARCFLFRGRIYDNTSNIDPTFAAKRKATCPFTGGDGNLAPLDSTPIRFDNAYYTDLVGRRGLFHSDQELFNNGSQDALVRRYSSNGAAFFTDFANAMVKMSAITPLTGLNGEIRKNCRVLN